MRKYRIVEIATGKILRDNMTRREAVENIYLVAAQYNITGFTKIEGYTV